MLNKILINLTVLTLLLFNTIITTITLIIINNLIYILLHINLYKNVKKTTKMHVYIQKTTQ